MLEACPPVTREMTFETCGEPGAGPAKVALPCGNVEETEAVEEVPAGLPAEARGDRGSAGR